MSKNRVLTIVPTYNEADNIKKMVGQLRRQGVDVLVVDDNSPDNTSLIVKRLAAKDRRVHLLQRPAKTGLGLAYRDAFRWGVKHGYQFFVSIDADFSHNPADVPRLIEAAKGKQAIAIGSRYVAGGKISGWETKRLVQSKLANFFARLLVGLKIRDVTAGFKCYPVAFVRRFVTEKVVAPGYAFHVETLFSAKLKQFPVVEIPITFSERRAGQSKVSGELPKAVVAVFKLMLRRPTLRQLVKFGIVGWINVAIDFGFLNLFVIVGGVPVLLAGLLSTAMALTNSYLMNRAWTFRGLRGSQQQGVEFVSFLAVNGTGGAVNWLIFAGLFKFVGLNYNLAKAIAILLTTFWNFFGSKKFVFNRSKN